jgi:signal transduction histidine kinase/CheY-like chemotaxis protein
MENIICKDDVSVETYTKKELIRFMMNNLHEAALLCRWGKNGNITIIDFNPLACRFLGFKHAELKQMNIYEIFTSESIVSAKKNLNPIPYENDDIWEAEILTKKRQKLKVEITNYKFILEGGIQILLSLKDISVHQGVLTNLKAYKKFYKISESIGKIGYWDYDLKSGNFWASQGTRSVFGIGEEELSVEDIPELGIAEYLHQIENMLHGLIVPDDLVESEFDICRISDNSVIEVRSLAEYDFIENKIFGLVQDISGHNIEKKELLEAKVEAEQKNHSRQAFISTISNEIYAPMNRIVGYCQLINQKDLPQETKDDYMESINKSCSLLHKLITDILDISRIEEEKTSVQSNKICISELLSETLIAWQQEALKKGIEIRLNLEDIQNDLTVKSDESKLTKVISNLMENAIRFTLEGYIEIGCLKKDSDLLFYIKDTGIGMSSAQYEMISDLFCQANTNPSQCTAGIGSGLAISKYYINILGGSIWIDSKLREGSTFYFTIPFFKGTDSIEKITIPETDNNIPDVRTCLIVDELEVNYFYLKALLTPLGFNVLWAKDGDEAIYMSIIENVDIVLMDIKMPVADDGYETTKIIKRKRPDILVFAQSVHAMNIDKDKAVQAGFDDIITKPVRRGDFMKKLDSIYAYK